MWYASHYMLFRHVNFTIMVGMQGTPKSDFLVEYYVLILRLRQKHIYMKKR